MQTFSLIARCSSTELRPHVVLPRGPILRAVDVSDELPETPVGTVRVSAGFEHLLEEVLPIRLEPVLPESIKDHVEG